jgi:glycosyltransferase involved in cell wall biosynthesis
MKILHITGYTVERGGTAKVVFDHSGYQIHHGHKVTILSLEFPGEEVYPTPAGVKLILVKPHFLSKYVSNFSTELNDYLKQKGDSFDVIHVHGIWFWGSVAPFIFNKKPRKYITIHGMLAKWTLQQGSLKKKIFGFLIQNKALKNAAGIVALTEAEKQEVLDYQKVNPKKIIVIPNTIEKTLAASPKEVRFVKDKFGLNDDFKKILFLSRIHKKKGLDLLVKAFALVLKEIKEPIKLIIAGPDEHYQEELQEIINQLGINEQIIFTGSVSGGVKKAIFEASDMFCLTSYSEGFPMAVLEAIEANLPVVVSNQTRIDEMIKKYKAGKVVELDILDIKNAIIDILTNSKSAKIMNSNAQKMLEKEYVPKKIFSEMLKLYKNH